MFFVTWTGLGWLFLLIPCIILTIGGFLTDILGLDMRVYLAHYLMIGLALSSIPCWFIGKKVNKEKVIAYDDETKEPIIGKNIHTLWSIPVQYFGVVLFVLAIICLFIIIFS